MPTPLKGDRGADIAGPSNLPRQAEEPDTIAPPETDAGTSPNLKWSFTDSHMRLAPGGRARQTTVRELPVSKEMAGVNMRLRANVFRELHWHKEAEWSYVIRAGRASPRSTRRDAPSRRRRRRRPLVFSRRVPLDPEVGQCVSLRQWLALTPHQLVQSHLMIDRALIDRLPGDKPSVIKE